MEPPKNILDPYFIDLIPHLPPQQQHEGVDILKSKCAEIELEALVGSTNAQLELMGQGDAASLPEEEHKKIVASGLDQLYWQLTKFLCVSIPLLPPIQPQRSLFN